MPFNNLVKHPDGLPRVLLSEPGGSSAEVLLYGGQVVSWKNERREELLFMSSKTKWKSPKAIRGGISVCFPQFANFGVLEQNGFAKNRLWSLDKSSSPLAPICNHSSVDLILKSTEEDIKTWPRSFELRLRISLDPGKLTLIPRVRSTDNKPFSFTFSLCNYLSVSDISEVRVEGLETLDYLDNLLQRKRFTEQADAVTFDGEVTSLSHTHTRTLSHTGIRTPKQMRICALEHADMLASTYPRRGCVGDILEVDRVYLSTPKKIAIIDHEKKRTFVLHKTGLRDAVLWNPWKKVAKALPNFGVEDYKTMLSVDSAAIENQIVLKPFEEWNGLQELFTVSSSYCSGQLDPRKVLYGFS